MCVVFVDYVMGLKEVEPGAGTVQVCRAKGSSCTVPAQKSNSFASPCPRQHFWVLLFRTRGLGVNQGALVICYEKKF